MIQIRLRHVDNHGRDQKTIIDSDPARLRDRVRVVCERFPSRYWLCELPREYERPTLRGAVHE